MLCFTIASLKTMLINIGFKLKANHYLRQLSFLVILLSITVPAQAESNIAPSAEAGISELPNPVTLDYLLTHFSQSSPQIQAQQAIINAFQAQQQQKAADSSWQLGLQGRLGWREFAEKTEDHHVLNLHVGKLLYDQGLADSILAASEKKTLAQQETLQHRLLTHQLETMKAYFEVLLADFQYRVDNEAMAIAYVGLDKLRDRHELGLVSDVELALSQSAFDASSAKRKQSELRQLQTRLTLSNQINQPQLRPDELQFPRLKTYIKRNISELSLAALQQAVLANNYVYKAAIAERDAAEQLMQQAKKDSGFRLRGDAWAGHLSSYPQIRDGSWRAAISMEYPLVDGGLRKGRETEAFARYQQAVSNVNQLALTLRNDVAAVYFQLQLLGAQKKQHQSFKNYAEIYLDWSRALYENEESTDFGDSLVRVSQADYNQAEWQLKQMLAWAQLDLLQGTPIFQPESTQ